MELRECPMCGGKAALLQLTSRERSTYKYVAGCDKCGLYTQGSVFKNDEYNAKAWNTRHDDWQEIALAPRDGTAVDLWGLGERHAGCHFVKCEVGDKDGWWENNTKKCAYSITFPFTHFRHLPKAPGEGR